MLDPRPYRNRQEAGRVLASRLGEQIDSAEVVVLALPRGGVPVGLEVAHALNAPLDVFIVRKLGAPIQPELAMGAIASGGVKIINRSVVAELGISEDEIDTVTKQESAELARRESLYRKDRPPLELQDRVVILVDDGLATGSTMRAAIAAVRHRGAGRLIVAVPVGAKDTCAELAREVDALICPLQPDVFMAIGTWYEDFTQTSDDEVRDALATAHREHSPPAAPGGRNRL